MKISYNWLKTYIDTGLSLEELCEKLTMSGLEVEHVNPVESIKGGLKGLIVGEVMSTAKHPNADKLSLTKVNIGTEDLLDIVCGAPNVAAGQKVVVAPVGTTIYPTNGEPFEIKKAKIRGEISEGMLCAEDEIGLGESHEGLLVLPENSVVGKEVAELYDIRTDYQIEIAIIPNRGDAISHVGVARELQALTGVRYKKPGTVSFDARGSMKVEVEVLDTVNCPRYSGITLNNIQIAPSPQWLKERLVNIGLKPINNVVDVTNYVQHELGQPIHAFDYDKLEGKRIEVRPARDGESLITLDEQERKLNANHLVICDQNKPIALAGILGGLHSGVSETTKTIFIESAYFNPVSIRKTAKDFGLNTDSSYRFERGADPNITETALRRVVNLIQDIAHGEPSSELIDIYPNPIADKEIALNLEDLNRFAGHMIQKDEVITILQNLEIKIIANNSDHLLLHVPPYRPDVDRPVDIYEEILRIYGFDNIPIPEKVHYRASVIDPNAPNLLQRKISDYLADIGFNEIMCNSLTTSSYYSADELAHSIPMLNPLSQEMGIMRMDLIHSGLESVAYNINRKNEDLKFFEFGKTYRRINDQFIEEQILQITTTGRLAQEHWTTTADPMSIHQLRGICENILRKLNIPAKHFKKLIEVESVGKDTLKKHAIKHSVLTATLHWGKCLELSSNELSLQDIPKFPVVRRDLSLVLSKNVQYKDIENIAKQTVPQHLKRINLFDVYEGKPLEEGEVSFSVAFYLYNDKKTMEDAEIDKLMDKLMNQYTSKLNAKIRS